MVSMLKPFYVLTMFSPWKLLKTGESVLKLVWRTCALSRTEKTWSFIFKLNYLNICIWGNKWILLKWIEVSETWSELEPGDVKLLIAFHDNLLNLSQAWVLVSFSGRGDSSYFSSKRRPFRSGEDIAEQICRCGSCRCGEFSTRETILIQNDFAVFFKYFAAIK